MKSVGAFFIADLSEVMLSHSGAFGVFSADMISARVSEYVFDWVLVSRELNFALLTIRVAGDDPGAEQ